MIRTSSTSLLIVLVWICHVMSLWSSPPPRTDVYGDPLPEGVRVRMGTINKFRVDHAQAAFSANGRELITCEWQDGMVQHWDVASGRLVREIELCKTPREKKELLAVTLGGRCAAMKMKDAVLFRDVESGEERGRLPLAADPETWGVTTASSDGKYCLIARNVGSRRKTLELWDVGRGKKSQSVKCEYDSLDAIFSRDGKRLALVINHRDLRLWDTATGKESRNNVMNWGMCFSPDGKTLAVNDEEGIVQLLDTETWKEKARLLRPEYRKPQWPHLDYSADGRLLVGNDADGILVWDVAARKLKHQLPDRHADELLLAPDGKTLACRGLVLDTKMRLWDVATAKQLYPRPGHEGHVMALAVSPDGKIVASGGHLDPYLYLWDAATGQLLHRFKGSNDWICACIFSPDGKQVVSSTHQGTIQVWDVARAAEVRRLQGDGLQHQTFFQFSPDGRCLSALQISFDVPARVIVWDLTAGKELCQRPCKIDIHRQDDLFGGSGWWIEEHAAFAPDGRSVTVKHGHHLAIEDVKSGRVLALLPEKVGKPLKFSRDGQLIAAASLNPDDDPSKKLTMDGIRLLETATGQEVVRIQTGRGDALDFSDDGRLLATIDKEAIHFWEVATGHELFRHPWPKSIRRKPDWPPATTLAFVPDTRGVVTGMGDGTILIWDVPAIVQPIRPAKHETPETLWSALVGEPRRAHRAIYTLAAIPAATLTFLADHLKPAAAFDAKLLAKLLADLDSEQFAVREAAQRALIQHRDDIEPALRHVLENKPTLEARRRIETILAAPRPVPPPSTLRTLRAIRVLEQIGTAEARKLLRKLAGGAAETRETHEAKAALERLARHTP